MVHTKESEKRGRIGLTIEQSRKSAQQRQRQQKIVNELHENDFFGEKSLLSNQKTNASVRTTTFCEMMAHYKTHMKEEAEKKAAEE